MIPIIAVPISTELEDQHRRADWFEGRVTGLVDFDKHEHHPDDRFYDSDGVQLGVPVDEANLITSLTPGAFALSNDEPFMEDGEDLLHRPVLDIDIPARLVDSTTPGHHHLYFDVDIPWYIYQQLLDALAEAGIIEPGYHRASIERKFTAVRPPWVKKETKKEAGY